MWIVMKGEIYSLLSGKSRYKGTFSRTYSISCIIQAIIYINETYI